MPTAAKLIAALCFACVGWLAANAHIPALGPTAAFGFFREICAMLGLIIGWRVMGTRVGTSYYDAMGSGLVTSVALAFFALLGFSIYLMIMQSTKMVYDGPMDAVLGAFTFMLENGQAMLTVGVMGALIGGGLLGGFLSEWTARRWR